MSTAAAPWALAARAESRPAIGADAIADALVAAGIGRIHLYPGGTIAPVLDAAGRRGIALFCARHEQGAGYAALAVARLTRRPQVVMVTSGPGVTNLVTPVADAWFDSVPLVVLTGQVGTADLRGDRPVRQRGFQEVDTPALLAPVVKAAYQPRHPDELPDVLAAAFRIATDGRPGPVLVDLPMDVQRGELTQSPAGGAATAGPALGAVAAAASPPPRESGVPAPDPAALGEAAAWITAARRPVVLAGQGVLLAGAHGPLRALAARGGGIPVAMSLLGLGAVPTDGALSLGFVGHTGNRTANRAVHEADLLLVVGARLDVRQTGTRVDAFAPRARVVRIDLDPAELAHARVRADLVLRADARAALAGLDRLLATAPLPDWSGWRAQIHTWQAEAPLAWDRLSPRVKPQHVIAVANRLTAGREVVVCSGVGSHQQWTARHFDFDHPRRSWLTSGGHGAMGFDLPAAIGSHLARPDATILCVVGDGSLQMNIQELQTLVDLDAPVKVVVLDNARLGIVSQFQRLNWQSDPTTGDKRNPDFAAIARAYGIAAWSVDAPAEVEAVLGAALAHPGPALVHCRVDADEDVVPMLLAGDPMDRMWPYA